MKRIGCTGSGVCSDHPAAARKADVHAVNAGGATPLHTASAFRPHSFRLAQCEWQGFSSATEDGRVAGAARETVTSSSQPSFNGADRNADASDGVSVSVSPRARVPGGGLADGDRGGNADRCRAAGEHPGAAGFSAACVDRWNRARPSTVEWAARRRCDCLRRGRLQVRLSSIRHGNDRRTRAVFHSWCTGRKTVRRSLGQSTGVLDYFWHAVHDDRVAVHPRFSSLQRLRSCLAGERCSCERPAHASMGSVH